MNQDIILQIAKELNVKERQVENILFATYLLSQNAKEKSPLLVSG